MKLHNLGTSGANTVLATINLPNDMLWVDEHKWLPAVANPTYSLTGALIVETAAKLLGRPITLQPPADMAWLTRSDVATLRTWASQPKCRFRLEFEYPSDTRSFFVIFRHQDGALEAEPVKGFPQHADEDYFMTTLRFTEVS